LYGGIAVDVIIEGQSQQTRKDKALARNKVCENAKNKRSSPPRTNRFKRMRTRKMMVQVMMIRRSLTYVSFYWRMEKKVVE
jgi:hypothetical protein